VTLALRTMIRFRHADAVIEPKPNRPATVADGPLGARYSLFYGSTYKQRGYPQDAIVVDPRAPLGEPSREFADHLEIASLRWRDVSERRQLLPRSRGLIEKLRAVEPRSRDGEYVFGENETRAALVRVWDDLRRRGLRARPKIVLPEWSRIPDTQST
jgi:hypothetical protein